MKINISSAKGKSKKPESGGARLPFHGYMIDHPAKDKKTFPSEKENEIRQEIQSVLEGFDSFPMTGHF